MLQGTSVRCAPHSPTADPWPTAPHTTPGGHGTRPAMWDSRSRSDTRVPRALASSTTVGATLRHQTQSPPAPTTTPVAAHPHQPKAPRQSPPAPTTTVAAHPHQHTAPKQRPPAQPHARWRPHPLCEPPPQTPPPPTCYARPFSCPPPSWPSPRRRALLENDLVTRGSLPSASPARGRATPLCARSRLRAFSPRLRAARFRLRRVPTGAAPSAPDGVLSLLLVAIFTLRRVQDFGGRFDR